MSERDHTLVERTISSLQQQRDELALQIHLGMAEARSEFERTTHKLDRMTSDFEPVKKAVGESARNVFSALKLVGEEVQASFDRIRASLEKD